MLEYRLVHLGLFQKISVGLATLFFSGDFDVEFHSVQPVHPFYTVEWLGSVKETLDYWIEILEPSCNVIIVLTSAGLPYDRERVYNNFNHWEIRISDHLSSEMKSNQDLTKRYFYTFSR